MITQRSKTGLYFRDRLNWLARSLGRCRAGLRDEVIAPHVQRSDVLSGLPNMRIGVNAFPLRANGGGARYVFAGLLSALLKLDGEHHYLIFAHPEALQLVDQVLKAHGDTLGLTGPDPRVKVIHISDEGQIYGHRFDFDLLF